MSDPAMANPIQQGLKLEGRDRMTGLDIARNG